MKLVSILESLAVDTWERLRDSRQLAINFGEETITDLLLMDLKRKHPPTSRIIQTPKTKEKDQGTDWEWWIGSDRTGWLRFAVQAKKLHLNTGRYTGLSHKVGGTFQIDLLERYAQANGAVPLYCFYNFVNPANIEQAWQCCQASVDEPQLACTITPSRIVRNAIASRGKKNFEWIHSNRETLPWRCLAGCARFKRAFGPPEDSVGPSEELADLFGQNLRLYSHLPPEVQDARSSGRMNRFSPEYYNNNVRLLPRRVVVLEFELGEENF